ncbi:baseplate hub subunit and tail lysozyme [Vibrio phage D480]|nr:baseplate hub subunit/ tail lysozyme [Vibrio phage 6E35.1a]
MFMGLEGFEWWTGVVEDRTSDPLKLGRLKVRMIGLHPEKKNSEQGIKTEDLLWVHPMQSLDNAAMNGIGNASIGVVEGTWLFGFYRDKLRQDAVAIGSLPGIPGEAANGSRGFNDPNEKYPLADKLNEPDTNRLARNDVSTDEYDEQTAVDEFNNGTTDYVHRPHPVIAAKRALDETEIPTAGYNEDGVPYDEPSTPYNAQYPFNHVRESESGHIQEIDDTEGVERLHTYHRTGTFEEIHPDGTKVTRIIGDDFEIVKRDQNLLVKGNLNITVVGDATFYCQSNVTQQIDGNLKQHVKGNVDQHVEMDVTQTVDQNVNQTVHQNVTQEVDGNVSQTVHQNVTQQVDQNVTQTVGGNVQSTVSGDYTQNISGNYSITVGGSMSESVSSSYTRSAASISDDGGGATLSLAGAAALDGSTVSLG